MPDDRSGPLAEDLFAKLSSLPEVEAIALGGSRAGEAYDEKSDYDVYLYCTSPVPEAVRREILTLYIWRRRRPGSTCPTRPCCGNGSSSGTGGC